MKILYVEDNAISANFALRLKRQKYEVDSAPNIGRAWSWLEEGRQYDAILLDADVGQNVDLYFENEEDREAVRSRKKFSGYVFYKSVICNNFPKYIDKTLFITAYFNQFKKTFDEASEFNELSIKIIDKREVGFESKVFDCLSHIQAMGRL